MLFNKALAWQIEQYAADKTVKFSYTALANLLPIWKLEPATACPAQPPQTPKRNLGEGPEGDEPQAEVRQQLEKGEG